MSQEKKEAELTFYDQLTYGVSVTVGGKRIAPEDFYLEPDKYVPLSQEECDRIWFSCDGWTRKIREAHKMGWDAAMNKK